ncbi:DUF6716 putative glycosyltransferase [Streptomyces sp. YIM 98790]|uniref:DUF6716 putative glycosyltransferase n=1 Tax=Streptomyces sp. YIM 98790 TaxID=2689077 RepID=UPI001407290F|nr:DUF6716 putative glycosyltransferase [Streptomyces sp. YIM 98790]
MPSFADVSVTSPAPRRVAVLADSDTRWKWGALTARRLAPGAELHGYLLRGRATPSPRQLAETGVSAAALRETSLAGLVEELAREDEPGRGTDLLLLACVGHTVQAALHALARRWPSAAHRPVVATGYVGVVYEKLVQGLLLRHGADLVLANSPFDAARFREVYSGVGAETGTVTPCALPFLGGPRHDPGAVRRGERPYRVVFAVQPSVPDTRRERAYLLDRAVAHARRHPDREVLLKLRSKPGEHTTHIDEVPYQRLAGRLPKESLPGNFRLVYGRMDEVLDTTDLLVTVSSTAALEALCRGIPTAVLTDLGIREPLGNHYYAGSGCYASWDELDDGRLPVPDPRWLTDQGVSPDPEGGRQGENPGNPGNPEDAEDAVDRAFAVARARLEALTVRARHDGLPPLAPYYTARTAPGYLPGLLARHGLDPKGEPLPGYRDPETAAGRGMRAATRRLVHRAARGAYRAGVQRVAPAVRRWGRM